MFRIFNSGKMAGIVIVGCFVALIVLLHATRFQRPLFVFEPPYLAPVLNTIFVSLMPLVVTFITFKSFMVSGSLNVLFFSCGVFFLGVSMFAATWLQNAFNSANVGVTIHNTGNLIASMAYAAGVIFSFGRKPKVANRRSLISILVYSSGVASVAFLVFLTLRESMPIFFTPGVGFTAIRQWVLGIAMALFAFGSLFLMKVYTRGKAAFLYWHSLAFLLYGTGLFGVWMQSAVGGPIGWVGRSAQFTSGIYFLIAGVAAFRSARASGVDVGAAIDSFFSESELNYRALLETITDAILSTDTQGRILVWNSAAERMFGYKRDEAVGFSVKEVAIFPELPEGIDLTTWRGANFELQEAAEMACRKRNGEEFPAEVTVSTRMTRAGGLLTFVIRDRTHRKLMEKRNQALVEASSDVLYQMSPDWGEMIQLNSQGFLTNTAKPNRNWINQYIHPDDQPHVTAVIREAIRTKGIFELEHRVMRADGTVGWTFSRAIPLLDANGNIVEWFGSASDITERKQIEKELLKSRDELEIRIQERTAELARANEEIKQEMERREKTEQQLRQAQKLEAIGTLTGGIAHDLNNIFAPIVINSELVLLDLPGDSGIRDNLDLILQSGLRGKDLVNQLLLFSRKCEKNQELISLTPLVKETFKLLRASIPTTIEMKLHLETESDAIYADPSQIQQVIMNLCTNAAFAMRGTTGSIDLSLQGITFGSNDLPEPDMQPGDHLVISVKDTGCGMDEEVRKRVFEPFFTTKQVGEGTGLGLSVAYGIAKTHKGNITVCSEPGKGSIFRVYLPRADTGLSVKTEIIKSLPRGIERILLVDDEEFVVSSVRNMLQQLGYKVTALTDSREALNLFSADPSQFDLVMTDQTMPHTTGEDLGREMMCLRPGIPVILCTGYSDLISSEKATAMGFQGFIMKPFTVGEGAELVRRVLDHKASSDK